MPKIIRILNKDHEFPTVNISKLNFVLVICIFFQLNLDNFKSKFPNI